MNAPTQPGNYEFKGIVAHEKLYADHHYYDEWVVCSVFNPEYFREPKGGELIGETWPEFGAGDFAPLSAFKGEWRHVKQTKTEASIPPATGIEALVCADIAARQQVGIAKYKTTLADNPAGRLERLQHIYEECLDQAAYLKWEIERTKGEMNQP